MPHFSSLSRPQLGRTAWDMPFGPSPMHTHFPPFCQFGIGAFDHVLRSAMLSKLMEVPQLQGLIPFVRSVYAHPATYAWEDEQSGSAHFSV